MKSRKKTWVFIAGIPLGLLFGLFLLVILVFFHPGHRHCIKQAGVALRMYAAENHDRFPFSTNGFGNALLLLVDTNSGDYLGGYVGCICGPDDDGHVFTEALKNHAVVPEALCTRIYIQGLSETNNPEICILFDRDSHRGGDHSRSLWAPYLREASLLDGSMQVIRDENWLEFSRKQVELLVAEGFSRSNALRFYPAAR